MSDDSKIEWTDATWPAETVCEFTEANGRHRRRIYTRKRTDRPGQQERRAQRAAGLAWCRGCTGWLALTEVRDGVCREHANTEARARYASDGEAIRLRVHARKRGVEPLPVLGADYLIEQFAGLCAYCPATAATWDHILAVANGGRTKPGNVVPACMSCNSSKKAIEVFSWLAQTGRSSKPELIDVLTLEMAA